MARSIRIISGLAALLLWSAPAFAAGTRHVCAFVSAPGNGGTVVYASVSCMAAVNSAGYPWSTNEVPVPWLAAGTASHLSITADVAPGVGKSRTVTLRKGSAGTALTVTLSGTNTTATSSTTVMLAVGDLLDLSLANSGSPSGTNISVSWTFDGTAAGVSSYAISPQTANPATSSTSYVPPFTFTNNHWSSVQLTDPVPTSGTITRYDVTLAAAPGTGKSWQAFFVKNGTVQNGAGVTTDTRLTIADTATSGSWTGSLAVSPSDLLVVGITPTGTPTAANTSVAVQFTATTDGQSLLCGESDDSPSTSAVGYQQLIPTSAHATFAWNTTEANRQVNIGPDTFTLGNLYVWLRSAPGTSKSYTLDLRQNAASPANAPTVTISGSNLQGNDTTHTLSISAADLLAMRMTPSGTPSAPAQQSWCFVETASPPAPGSSTFPALTVAP